MSTATQTPTMSAADRTAHDLASHVRMAPEVRRAVVRYENAAETLAELEGTRITTAIQFRQLADAQDTIAESKATLAAAGMLHLIEVAP